MHRLAKVHRQNVVAEIFFAIGKVAWSAIPAWPDAGYTDCSTAPATPAATRPVLKLLPGETVAFPAGSRPVNTTPGFQLSNPPGF